MNFHIQGWSCHPERSEGSEGPVSMGTEILRCAQDDKALPILIVKVHHRAPTHVHRPLPTNRSYTYLAFPYGILQFSMLSPIN
jgi:hypothetical protein